MAAMRKRLRSMRVGKNTLIFLVEILVAGGVFALLQFVFTPVGAFSIFPAAILLMMVGVGVLLYLTRMHMGGCSMQKAIEQKNTAFALIVLAFAIIIAAAISII